MMDPDIEGFDDGEYAVTVLGLQSAVDAAGARYDAGDEMAGLDLIIFAGYAHMMGWLMVNRTILGVEGDPEGG